MKKLFTFMLIFNCIHSMLRTHAENKKVEQSTINNEKLTQEKANQIKNICENLNTQFSNYQRQLESVYFKNNSIHILSKKFDQSEDFWEYMKISGHFLTQYIFKHYSQILIENINNPESRMWQYTLDKVLETIPYYEDLLFYYCCHCNINYILNKLFKHEIKVRKALNKKKNDFVDLINDTYNITCKFQELYEIFYKKEYQNMQIYKSLILLR